MMLGALFVPGLIIITGFLFPFVRGNDEFQVQHLINHPLTRLFLVVVISSSLFHWAHRFRYILFDLGIKRGKTAIAAGCYGAAIAGTVAAALIALGLI